jgi:hypothetical protein
MTLDEARRRIEAENARLIQEGLAALTMAVLELQESELRKISLQMGYGEPEDSIETAFVN